MAGQQGIRTRSSKLRSWLRNVTSMIVPIAESRNVQFRGLYNKGHLEIERYESYLKLQRELRYMATKENDKLRFQEKERMKNLHTQQEDYKSMR